MKDQFSLVTKIGGFAVAFGMRRLLETLEIKVAHYDRSTDPACVEYQGPGVYVLWHEYMGLPITLWRKYNVALLISQHHDADWLARAAYHLGFEAVRGSTTRGGSSALRELKRISTQYNLVFTPDGPRGPRRQMSLGPIYLASRLGLPLIPLAVGYDRPWRMQTWDRFAVPRPYSRARAILGPRLSVPAKLKREGLEHYRQRVERSLVQLTQVAEQWAQSGGRMKEEMPFRRRRKAYHAFRTHSPHALQGPHTGRKRKHGQRGDRVVASQFENQLRSGQ